jgi:hypothetical protein
MRLRRTWSFRSCGDAEWRTFRTCINLPNRVSSCTAYLCVRRPPPPGPEIKAGELDTAVVVNYKPAEGR